MPDHPELLLAHLDAFVSFVRRRVHDPDLAADVVQDALAKAMERHNQLRDEERLLAWFYRVLRNTITDLQRRLAREQRHLSDVMPAESAALPEEDQKSLCACLLRLVDTLESDQAEVLRAVDLNQEEAEVVAARLGITRNNLVVRRHRARQALAQKLRATCRLCAEHGCLDCDCSD